MRKLSEHGLGVTLPFAVFSVLQLCAISGSLFPNLKSLTFELATEESIPFVPLFLSARLTSIEMAFSGSKRCGSMATSFVIALPALCPSLQKIIFRSCPVYPMVTAAVSGMLLATNRDTLQSLRVDSPLTEEAYKWIFQLPNLRELWVVIKGDVSLPSAVLPNLTRLAIEHSRDGDWSQMFHGATLYKLESVTFLSALKQIGDFLETFERVTLSISAQKTLSKLHIHNDTLPWNPNYSCLLPFTRLTHLSIVYPCDGDCSSTPDDDVITNLAQTMPKLEILQLGDSPCSTPTGVTVKGLMVLAHNCLGLSALRLHFQVDSFCAPLVDAGVAPDPRFTVARRECALQDLEVGYIIVPEESALVVALTLLRIFPHIQCIDYECEGWRQVADAIRVSRQIVNYPGD